MDRNMKKGKWKAALCVFVCMFLILAAVLYNISRNRKRADAAEHYLYTVYSAYARGEYSETEDVPIDGKVMVYIAAESETDSSPRSTVHGRNYYGMENSLFTANPADCTAILIVYPEYTKTGFYLSDGFGSSKGNAYSTAVCVVVVHPDSGAVTPPRVIVSNEPSKAKNTAGSSYGIFEPEKAMDYIAGLLGYEDGYLHSAASRHYEWVAYMRTALLILTVAGITGLVVHKRRKKRV